jgi:MFS family permease
VSSAAAERTGGKGGRGRAARLRAAFSSGPLAVRDFRLFGIGQLTSTAGDYCYAVALPWLVLSGHGGTVLLGTVLACYGVPRTVLIPLGGVLADRISARTVMLIADSVRCVLVAVLALVAAKGLVSIAFLGPVAALIGAGEGVFLPASAAIMPSLLPAESLQEGNGLSAAMIQVGSLLGPVLGGILVTLGGSGTTGSAVAFAVDAATFAVSAGALALMRARLQASLAGEENTSARTPVQADPTATAAASSADVTPQPVPAVTAAGPVGAPTAAEATSTEGGTVEDQAAAADGPSVWQLLKRSRELQMILLIAVLANFVIAGAFEVALPTLSHARFGPAGYGALIACFGFGSLGGTLTAARIRGQRRPALGACAAFAAAGVAVALLPFLGGLPGAAAAAAVFGAAGNYGNVVIVTLLQRWAPPDLIGRVMSLVMLCAMGAFPASVALSGVIVRSIGPAPFFPAAGAVLALSVLIAASQHQFRNFGRREDAGPVDASADQAAVVTAR